MLRTYQEGLLLEVVPGTDPAARRRRAYTIATLADNARRIRELATIGTDATLDDQAKIKAMLAGLAETLVPLRVDHLHTPDKIEALTRDLTSLLAEPDPDMIYADLTTQVELLIRPLFEPLLAAHPSGLSLDELLDGLMKAVHFALAKFRHRQFDHDRTVDTITGYIGWCAGKLGIDNGFVLDIHPVSTQIWALLEPYKAPEPA